MSPQKQGPVLLVIDVQQAFDNPKWGRRNNPAAEKKIAELLSAWRAKRFPVIHVRHLNSKPESLFNEGSAGFQVKPEAESMAGEPILYKNVNSAFIGTDLDSRLHTLGATAIVIVGLTTDHCVSTTTRMSANLGFETYAVSDATATFERTGHDERHHSAQEMHDTALASLHGEFAKIVSTEQALEAFASERVDS